MSNRFKTSNHTKPTTKGRRAPLRVSQDVVEQLVDDVPQLIRKDTIIDVMDSLSPDGKAVLGFMINSGSFYAKDEPNLQILDAKLLAEHHGIDPNDLIDPLMELSMYLLPVNDQGLYLRPISVLGWTQEPDPERGGNMAITTITLYVVPIQKPKGDA